MCIYQLFLILDHTKSYVEKKTLKIGDHHWGAHGHQVAQGPSRLSRGIGVAKRHGHQISSISCRFALWEVLSQKNTVVRWKSKYLAQKKFSAWLHYCPRACSKNNISMISVFTLRNILIVNTKKIKGTLSNIHISEACIKLVALCINRHIRSSSQLQEGWWSLL